MAGLRWDEGQGGGGTDRCRLGAWASFSGDEDAMLPADGGEAWVQGETGGVLASGRRGRAAPVGTLAHANRSVP